MTSSLTINSHRIKGSKSGDQLPKSIEALFMEIDPVSAVVVREPLDLNQHISEPGHNGCKRYCADNLPERDAVSNPIRRYLRQIGRYKLLSGEDEVEIAKKPNTAFEMAITEMDLLKSSLTESGCPSMKWTGF